MKQAKRVFVIVIDSLGIGVMPDGENLGSIGVNTLGHISESVEQFHTPTLQKLGMANLTKLARCRRQSIRSDTRRLFGSGAMERYDDRTLGDHGSGDEKAIQNVYRTWISQGAH